MGKQDRFTNEFKRDAVAQVVERAYRCRRLGGFGEGQANEERTVVMPRDERGQVTDTASRNGKIGSYKVDRLFLALFLAVLPTFGSAQGFEKGANAFAARDFATALKEWIPLAEQGNAQAQASLGEMYLSGVGVPKDLVSALKLLRLAADQGHPSAQFNLGVMYGRGDGVSHDPTEAAKWYGRAAVQGNAHAQNNLGVLYSKGLGVTQNFVLAADWFRKAARGGEANAQNTLGKMLSEGLGMPQDQVSAHMWFTIAAANGSSESAINLATVSAKMTQAEISEAMKMATECTASGYLNC